MSKRYRLRWWRKFRNPSAKPTTSPVNVEKSIADLENLRDSQAEEILKLEKEAVYWKEKAMNFKRFHQ